MSDDLIGALMATAKAESDLPIARDVRIFHIYVGLVLDGEVRVVREVAFLPQPQQAKQRVDYPIRVETLEASARYALAMSLRKLARDGHVLEVIPCLEDATDGDFIPAASAD